MQVYLLTEQYRNVNFKPLKMKMVLKFLKHSRFTHDINDVRHSRVATLKTLVLAPKQQPY